jgi:hypothetical protein
MHRKLGYERGIDGFGSEMLARFLSFPSSFQDHKSDKEEMQMW